VDFNKARDDGIALASARPNANHLQLTPDRQPCQHLITQFFTRWMLCWPPNYAKAEKANTKRQINAKSDR